MTVDLRGAVVVVTGASSGFGELAAVRFARSGASVVLAARRVERLEELAERIERRGGRALPVECDVTELGDLEDLRARVAEALGRLDVLVNNAGIPGGGRFEDLDIEQIVRVVRVNVLGVMLGTKVFLPMLLERGRGHVVNVSSMAGHFAAPGASVYSATKFAVRAFSEALYHELRPKGILVTSVHPAFAKTEGFPMTHMPKVLVMDADRVARAIVDAVRRGRAPEVNVPRGLPVLQAFRYLTPPLYRWGVRTVTDRFRAAPARR